MKCPICGNSEFAAHQQCYLDVIVDENNSFLRNAEETADASIYEASEPYGPYTCTKCGYEFDEVQ